MNEKAEKIENIQQQICKICRLPLIPDENFCCLKCGSLISPYQLQKINKQLNEKIRELEKARESKFKVSKKWLEKKLKEEFPED